MKSKINAGDVFEFSKKNKPSAQEDTKNDDTELSAEEQTLLDRAHRAHISVKPEFVKWATEEIKELEKKSGLELKPTFKEVLGGSYKPIAIVMYRGRSLGVLSADPGMKKTFALKSNVIPEKYVGLHPVSDIVLATKPTMINILKDIKKSLATKTLDVHTGGKPTNWATPPLKRAQQKSLLKLVKSKYQIRIIR